MRLPIGGVNDDGVIRNSELRRIVLLHFDLVGGAF